VYLCAGVEADAAPPATPQPRLIRSGARRTVYSLAGDFEMDLPTFHCDTCNTDICPRAEQVGCFEVQMEPPNSKRIYWVDIRLLEEQKHLSLRKTTFSGAWPRDEASLRCLNLRARARMGKAEGVWLAEWTLPCSLSRSTSTKSMPGGASLLRAVCAEIACLRAG
jgi:hypothetical protein